MDFKPIDLGGDKLIREQLTQRECEKPDDAVTGVCPSYLGAPDESRTVIGKTYLTTQVEEDRLEGSCGVEIMKFKRDTETFRYRIRRSQKLQRTRLTCTEGEGDTAGQNCPTLNVFNALFSPQTVNICNMHKESISWEFDEECKGTCDEAIIDEMVAFEPYVTLWEDFQAIIAGYTNADVTIVYPCGANNASEIGQGQVITRTLVETAILRLGDGFKACDLYVNKNSLVYADQSLRASSLTCDCELGVVKGIEALGVKVHQMKTIPTYAPNATDPHDGTAWATAVTGSEAYLIGGMKTQKGCKISNTELGGSILAMYKDPRRWDAPTCNGNHIKGINYAHEVRVINACGIIIIKFADTPCCKACATTVYIDRRQ